MLKKYYIRKTTLSAALIAAVISLFTTISIIIYRNALIISIWFFLLYFLLLFPIFYFYVSSINKTSWPRYLLALCTALLSYCIVAYIFYFSAFPYFETLHTDYGINAFGWDGGLIRSLYLIPVFGIVAGGSAFLLNKFQKKPKKEIGLSTHSLTIVVIITLSVLLFVTQLV